MSARRTPKPQPPFVTRCLALLMPLGPVRARAMFGGWGLYLDAVMFALIAGEQLYLKVDATSRERFAAAGSEPFTYRGRGKPIEMSYWRAPEGSLDGPDGLLPWAELALAAAQGARRHKA